MPPLMINFWQLPRTSKSLNMKNMFLEGSLVECYDELGTRYSIPVYCLSWPINLINEADRWGYIFGLDSSRIRMTWLKSLLDGSRKQKGFLKCPDQHF